MLNCKSLVGYCFYLFLENNIMSSVVCCHVLCLPMLSALKRWFLQNNNPMRDSTTPMLVTSSTPKSKPRIMAAVLIKIGEGGMNVEEGLDCSETELVGTAATVVEISSGSAG